MKIADQFNNSAIVKPRFLATSENGLKDLRASKVALAALRGDFEPKDFERMFSIPASSRTERTAPPAIIPVP